MSELGMLRGLRRFYVSGGWSDAKLTQFRDTLADIGLYITNTGNILQNNDHHVKHNGVWFHEDEITVCAHCDSVQINGSPSIHGIIDGEDVKFCSELCAKEEGMRKNRWGEYVYKPELGQVGKAEYTATTGVSEATDDHPFLIGLEIEKEDPDSYRDLCDTKKGLKVPPKWLVVHDGSLDSECGFEMVSHGYNLTKERDTLNKDLDSITDVLNGRTTAKCGGHITVSEKGVNGMDLAKQLRPLAALMLTLFPNRMNNSKINMLNFDNCVNSADKYTPLRIMPDRVEFRMISAVKSKNSLKRRIAIIEWFLKNKPSFKQVLKEMEQGGIIQKAYSKVYGEETWKEKMDNFKKMSIWFCWNRNQFEIKTLVNEY
jgi:hypothetical protein